MFYYISGKLAYKDANTAVIDAAGVGYKMTISGSTYDTLPQINEVAKLYTHMAVREDAVELFGFSSNQEMSTFKMLITVSGIGPKNAISILSTLTPEKFALAVCTEDTKAISKANGIGSKTAARIVLELKDKMLKEQGDLSINNTISAKSFAQAPSGTNRGKLSEATDALVVLGYSRAEALNVLRDVDFEHMELEEIIRQSLKKLMKY